MSTWHGFTYLGNGHEDEWKKQSRMFLRRTMDMRSLPVAVAEPGTNMPGNRFDDEWPDWCWALTRAYTTPAGKKGEPFPVVGTGARMYPAYKGVYGPGPTDLVDRAHTVSLALLFYGMSLSEWAAFFKELQRDAGEPLVIAHVCLGRAGCINPDHLFLDSESNNARRAARRARAAR